MGFDLIIITLGSGGNDLFFTKIVFLEQALMSTMGFKVDRRLLTFSIEGRCFCKTLKKYDRRGIAD